MIEANFEYTENLIHKINSTSMKTETLIIKIAMLVILLGSAILFITSNTTLGFIFLGMFAILLISLSVNSKDINKSNRILIGQKINIMFNENSMTAINKLGEKTLYKANFKYSAIKKIKYKQDLLFIYFDKTSVVIIPKNSFKTLQEYERALELIRNDYSV